MEVLLIDEMRNWPDVMRRKHDWVRLFRRDCPFNTEFTEREEKRPRPSRLRG